MKLVFKKSKDAEISVFQKLDDQEKEFSYVDMIKCLIKSKKLEQPEICGEFTEAEVKSINSMVRHINSRVSSISGSGS